MTTKPSQDTIRLLEASTDSLFLAIVGLSIPKRSISHDSMSQYSTEIGLIGVASELAMSAILVECQGLNTLLLNNGHYKSGAQILESFREMFRKEVTSSTPILEGIDDIAHFTETLLSYTSRFRILTSLRAAGLHAGKGVNLETAVSIAREVADFLKQLGESPILNPYLKNVPFPANLVRERTILVEDLINQINSAHNIEEQARLIQSLFLVLPDIPEEMPDWLNSLDRITITPEEQDISLLLNVIEKAYPISLVRQSATGNIVPVKVVQPDNPNAIPVSSTDIKREFTQLRDQWFADVANANARLKEGILDLPPEGFTLKVFVSGLDSIQIALPNEKLPAQQTWPFIISSIYQAGTQRPFWFVVERTNDLRELVTFLQRAAAFGNANVKKALPDVVDSIKHMDSGRDLPESSTIHRAMHSLYQKASQKRNSINKAISRHQTNNRAASEELQNHLLQMVKGEISLGTLLTMLTEEQIPLQFEAKRYWSGLLAESAIEKEDAIGLFSLLRTKELITTHTYAKKGLLLLDFLHYGPKNSFFVSPHK